MVFSSILFLFLFLPICLLIYYNPFFKSIKFKNIVLLIFSIIFYCYGSFKYFYVLVLSVFFNYIIGLLLDKVKYRGVILFFGVLVNVSVFLYFKTMGTIAGMNSITFLPLVGPLGISFFTFQELSYIIDVYRKVVSPQKNIFKYALYVTFFPQLIAGPIVRYEDVQNEMEDRHVTFEKVKFGITKIVIGLFKKCVIADTLAYVSMAIFFGEVTSLCSSWLGAILLALQLYYDFSAYSDMAIGLAKIFGFNIKENFIYPYSAGSVNQFWKKWNISLGTWFNDYVLFPICNSKIYLYVLKKISKYNKKFAYTFCNFIALLICWIIVGLWHGIAVNYLYLGLYYFIFIFLEKKIRIFQNKKILSNIYTLFIVILGTVIFFSFKDPKLLFFRSLFSLKTIIDPKFIIYLEKYFIYIIIAIIFSFPVAEKIKNKFCNYKLYPVISTLIVFCMFIVSIYYLIINDYSPFLYFNF